MEESARAVLLTPDGQVLLIRIAGGLWITPGGRLRRGEDARSALERELFEETGRDDLPVGAELWVRHGTYPAGDRRLPERERFFLVPTERFEPSASAMGAPEVARFRGFGWWSVEDVGRSEEHFVPRSLGALLVALLRDGAPARPVETGE